MNTPTFKGLVRFKVAGQKALPKWAQQAITNALAVQETPPESLRFQCRIATDAKANFERVDLADGESLSLSAKGSPQFGKNHEGKPYLTVTVIYSGDGQSYRLRWLGAAVPPKMTEVAVKHDRGLDVRPTTVGLDLAKAEVTPTWRANSQRGPAKGRDYKAEVARRRELRAQGADRPKRKRRCARITEADLATS